MGHPLDRREFLQAASAAAAALAAACVPGRPDDIISADERATLAAMCERIVPADDFPGATDTGVVEFIERQLATHYSDYRALYRLGLQGVAETAIAAFAAPFARLGADQQTAVLRSIEVNQAQGTVWRSTDATTFFRLVVAHTMYGYYGDPRHGGNRNAASWTMLGLPYPPVRGRDHYSLDAGTPPRKRS